MRFNIKSMEIFKHSYPSYPETFAQLGVMLQAYLSIPILLSGLAPSQNSEWNRLVRTEVYRINDPLLDLQDAYDLMDKQKDKCKSCNADLMLDRIPTLHRDVKTHTFFCCKSNEIRFSWYCSDCIPNTKKESESLDNKISRMVSDEFNDADDDNMIVDKPWDL